MRRRGPGAGPASTRRARCGAVRASEIESPCSAECSERIPLTLSATSIPPKHARRRRAHVHLNKQELKCEKPCPAPARGTAPAEIDRAAPEYPADERSSCRDRAGARLSSPRRRCYVGTVGWSRGAGPTRVGSADRRSAARSASSCCASRAKPAVGYQRIAAELRGLSFAVSATTVRKLLREARLGPGGERGGLCGREFLHTQAQSMIAVDFFTVETVWLQRLYVLFFIELGGRRVHLAGCTANPSGSWVTQQTRQLGWTSTEHSTPLRFLIRDRDCKYTRDFDTVFRSEGIEIVRTRFERRERTRSPSASSAPSARNASTGS